MILGGYYSSASRAIVETWDGSSWTEIGDLNTAGYGRGGSGTSTLALAFAGSPTTANTEEFDGGAWTEVANLSDNRHSVGGTPAGTQSAALCYGGQSGASGGVTEEWAKAQNIKVLTD